MATAASKRLTHATAAVVALVFGAALSSAAWAQAATGQRQPDLAPLAKENVDSLKEYEFFTWLLAQPEFFAGLPVPTVPLTVIAGTKGWPRPVSLFGAEPNDGVVAVAETRLSATATVVELPASHTFMMNNRQVRTLVRELLARAAGRDGVTA